MNDLVEFLRDRLDEDGAYAHEPGDWNEYNPGDPADPARVLREVEAKRRMLDDHTFEGRPNAHDCPGTWVGYCDDPDEPCPTLRLLALPYADHDDFREEWRP